jgi:UDP-N-acetylmuramyl tripeptide synthase
LAFEVIEGAQVQTLRTRLMGDYNIDNLLGVIGSLRALGISTWPSRAGLCAPDGSAWPHAARDF